MEFQSTHEWNLSNEKGKRMGYEFAQSIQSDLSALTGALHRSGPAAIAPPQHDQAGASFADSMQAAFAGVNADDRAAAQKMAAVDSGQSDDLVGAMLASQQANLSFSMLVQVRNKVVGAVDELIKLPI